MAKHPYQEDITNEIRKDDTNFGSYNENARKERGVTEMSCRVDRSKKGNGNTSKQFSKNNRRKKERIRKHSSIHLDPSYLSINSYIPTHGKTKITVSNRDKRNNSTLRSKDQWKLGSNPNFAVKRNSNVMRNTSSSSDYFFVVPISEIGCPEANVNVVKRLMHMKKLNHQQKWQQLNENKIRISPALLIPNEESNRKGHFRDPKKYRKKVIQENSSAKDKISNKQQFLNAHINTAKSSLDYKEKGDIDSFNNLKENLVKFVSNTFLYTERKHNDQNQNNGVKENKQAAPPRSTLKNPNKIINQRREHRRKTIEGNKTCSYSFGQEVFLDSRNKDGLHEECVLSNRFKESFAKQQLAFDKQNFQNYSNDYYSESKHSNLMNCKPIKVKNNNLKRSSMNNSKNKTTNDNFEQVKDDLDSDVVILNASHSQFFKISDFLKIKHSCSNFKSEIKGTVFYESETPYKKKPFLGIQQVECSDRFDNKVINGGLKSVRFPLDSFRDVLVYNGKLKGSTIKRLSKQLNNNSDVSNLTSRIVKDKNLHQEYSGNTERLGEPLENNSSVSNLTRRTINDKNCNQGFKTSTKCSTKQLDNSSDVSNLKSRIPNDKHSNKELKNNSNLTRMRQEHSHQSCYNMKIEHNSTEHDMVPELDRPPSQKLKRKQSCFEKSGQSLPNNPTVHSESDLSIKRTKKSTKYLNEPLRINQAEYLEFDPLVQGAFQEQSSNTLNNFDKVDKDCSHKMFSDHCTLNETEISNTKYSRFEINQKDSSIKTTKSKATIFHNFDNQPSTKSHQQENCHYNNYPKYQPFVKNNQRPHVSIAVQTELHLMDTLKKQHEYSKNTKGTLTNDLEEHIYINKHIRSQIENAYPKFVQIGQPSLTEVFPNNKQNFSNKTREKTTTNVSVPSNSDTLIPVPIISEPDDFFDDFISLGSKRITFGSRIDECNYISEMHNNGRKNNMLSSQFHSKSSCSVSLLSYETEKQLTCQPLKEFINTKLENEVSIGLNMQNQLSPQEDSDARTLKYSKRGSTMYSEWQFSNNKRQTILYADNMFNENPMNLKRSNLITRFIKENIDNERNNINNAISPPQSQSVINIYQCSNLDKQQNIRMISNGNNEGMELPVTAQEGRMNENNEEMKTKHSEQQSSVEISRDLPYQSSIKLIDSELLNLGKNNNLSADNLIAKQADRNNEGMHLPSPLYQMHSIEGTEESKEDIKTITEMHSFIATFQNLPYKSVGKSENTVMEGKPVCLKEIPSLSAGSLLEKNGDRNIKGTKSLMSLQSTDITYNIYKDVKTPGALQSLVEIDINPTNEITEKPSTITEILGSEINKNSRSSILVIKGSDRHNEGMKTHTSYHSTDKRYNSKEEGETKIPILLEKDISSSILLEKNIETDNNQLNLFEQLPRKSSQSSSQGYSHLESYPMNKKTSNITIKNIINKSELLLEPSDVEIEEQSKRHKYELLKTESQHETRFENRINYNLIRKQSVDHIFENFPIEYNKKGISDISFEQHDLNLSISNISSFDHILLNISIRDKETKNMPESKNHRYIPFKKSLMLMPINKRKHNDYKGCKDNDPECTEKFDSNRHCLNEFGVITPTNNEIESSRTPPLGSRSGRNISIKISTEENTAYVSSNNELNATVSSQSRNEIELDKKNAKVKTAHVRSNNASEIIDIENNSDKTSQSDKLEKQKKITKMSKRKLNRIFLCNYVNYIPLLNTINKLGGLNILTDKGQQLLLYTRFVKCYTKNHIIDDPLASINYSLNRLKSHWYENKKCSFN